MRVISTFISLTRPKQWLKNLMLFFPPFLSGSLFKSTQYLYDGAGAFVAFSFVASALYVINDICDASRDLLHPVKQNRAIPAGYVSVRSAALFAVILAIIGFGAAAWLVSHVIHYLCAYVILTLLYTKYLKKMPVVDVFCIATGFLLRLQAGGVSFQVVITEWLFFSVFFLALFMSVGKRLSEIKMLGVSAANHRESLHGYPEGMLDAMLNISAATVLVTYTLYSLSHDRLYFTVPLCAFGLFRYIFRIKSGLGGDPTDSLLKDIPLLLVSICWVIQVGWSIYG